VGKRDVRVKRVYEPPEKDDGTRVLVDRLWPRGISKEAEPWDVWAKDAAPSAELRKWYGHDPAKYDEFERRYLDELTAADAVGDLRDLVERGPVTLLTATRDVELSQAPILARFLERPT